MNSLNFQNDRVVVNLQNYVESKQNGYVDDVANLNEKLLKHTNILNILVRDIKELKEKLCQDREECKRLKAAHNAWEKEKIAGEKYVLKANTKLPKMHQKLLTLKTEVERNAYMLEQQIASDIQEVTRLCTKMDKDLERCISFEKHLQDLKTKLVYVKAEKERLQTLKSKHCTIQGQIEKLAQNRSYLKHCLTLKRKEAEKKIRKL